MEPHPKYPPDPSEPRWLATFGDGSTIEVWGGTVFLNEADPDNGLRERMEEVWTEKGWPDLPGWDIDTSPGFDPEWNYLRLLALGAVTVTGPFPQQHVLDAEVPDGTIVG